MANREWNNPNERAEYERQRLAAEDELRPRSTAAWFGWWWVWLLVIIFAFFWFAGWGWWGYGGWWGWGNGRGAQTQAYGAYNNGAGGNGGYAGNAAGNTGATRSGEVASVAEVLSRPQQFEGHRVLVPSIVQQRINNHAILVGADKTQELAVAVPANTDIHQGEQVEISATVTKPPQEQQLQQNLGLNTNQARQIENSGVYLEAYAVNSANGGQNGGANQ